MYKIETNQYTGKQYIVFNAKATKRYFRGVTSITVPNYTYIYEARQMHNNAVHVFVIGKTYPSGGGELIKIIKDCQADLSMDALFNIAMSVI